jgi:hypothetical protein
MDLSRPCLSVVRPVYNEERNVATMAGCLAEIAGPFGTGSDDLGVLGIIGEYIGRLLGETRRWPVYLVAETEETNRPVNASPARGAARAAAA